MTRAFWRGYAAGAGTPPVAYGLWLLLRFLLRDTQAPVESESVTRLFREKESE